MKNVGGSAGASGYDFQACLVAFVAVHILTRASMEELEGDFFHYPIAVKPEIYGPGDDLWIEFESGRKFQVQAKKGLHIDKRFEDTLDKIAMGLAQDTSSQVILAIDPTATQRLREKLPRDLQRLRSGREDAPHDADLLNTVLNVFRRHTISQEDARSLVKRLFVIVFDIEDTVSKEVLRAFNLLHSLIVEDDHKATWDILVRAGLQIMKGRGSHNRESLMRLLKSRNIRFLESQQKDDRIEMFAVWMARNQTRQWNLEMNREKTLCPNSFLIVKDYGILRYLNPKSWFCRTYRLHLLCQHPAGPHIASSTDGYPLREVQEWCKALIPWLRYPGDTIEHVLMESHLDSKIWISGPALRALHRFLTKADPYCFWGGLYQTVTPDGNVLWLCGIHHHPYEVEPLDLGGEDEERGG